MKIIHKKISNKYSIKLWESKDKLNQDSDNDNSSLSSNDDYYNHYLHNQNIVNDWIVV